MKKDTLLNIKTEGDDPVDIGFKETYFYRSASGKYYLIEKGSLSSVFTGMKATGERVRPERIEFLTYKEARDYAKENLSEKAFAKNFIVSPSADGFKVKTLALKLGDDLIYDLKRYALQNNTKVADVVDFALRDFLRDKEIKPL